MKMCEEVSHVHEVFGNVLESRPYPGGIQGTKTLEVLKADFTTDGIRKKREKKKAQPYDARVAVRVKMNDSQHDETL